MKDRLSPPELHHRTVSHTTAARKQEQGPAGLLNPEQSEMLPKGDIPTDAE